MQNKTLYALLALALLLAPLLGAYPVFMLKVLCFGLFACSFNLLIGYTGLLSFGHAAFFGCAAYLAGHALKHWGLDPLLALLLGTACGAVIGAAMGYVAIRRQGIYFTMITLALAQMLFFLCLQSPLTGGEDGLQAIPRGQLLGLLDLGDDLTMYYYGLVLLALAFLLIIRVVHSPFGQILKAIKENEARATSLGYDVAHYKLLAFVISAALAGLAGALKAQLFGFATLTDVHWSMSGTVVLMTLVGGLATFSGPLLGAFVVVTIENKLGEIGNKLAELTGIDWFATLGDSVTLVTGAIFILCVLAFRRGIMGELASRRAKNQR